MSGGERMEGVFAHCRGIGAAPCGNAVLKAGTLCKACREAFGASHLDKRQADDRFAAGEVQVYERRGGRLRARGGQ